MKQYLLIAAAVAALSFAACTKNELPAGPESNGPDVLTAEVLSMRTSVTDAGVMTWNTGDAIKVYTSKSAWQEFTTTSEGSAKADFTGDLDGGTAVMAVHPAALAPSLAGNALTVTLPAAYTLDGTQNNAALVGSVSGSSITFRNLAGVLKLDLRNLPSTAESIVVAADTKLNGSFVVADYTDADAQIATASTLTASEKSVTINFAAGTLNREFWMPLPTGTYAFTVDVMDGSSNVIKHFSSKSAYTIDRSSLLLINPANANTIKNADELIRFLKIAHTFSASDKFVITADIDFASATESFESASGFAGELDGQNHTIANWAAASPLFTEVSGTVKNISIASTSSLAAGDGGDIAFIVGHVLAGGSVTGCVNDAPITRTADFTSTAKVGAIVGRLQGTMSGCTNNGNITLTMASAANEHVVGGVVGYCDAAAETDVDKISDCHNTGDITLSYSGTPAKTFLGGVLGTSTATGFSSAPANIGNIRSCTNTGDVSYSVGTNGGGTHANVGGVAGYFEGRVLSCTNEGAVSYVAEKVENRVCRRPAIGGVVGYSAFSVKNCINRGSVTLEGGFYSATANDRGAGANHEMLFGGIAGGVGSNAYVASEEVSGCYNYGALTTDVRGADGASGGLNIGGIVGYCNIHIRNCHNANEATPSAVYIKTRAGYPRAGGIVGYVASGYVSESSNAKDITFDLNNTAGSPNKCSVQARCGGIVGYFVPYNGVIENCSNSGALTLQNGWHNQSKESCLGGILGDSARNSNDVHGCHNTGTITSTSASYLLVGGLCGVMYGTLTNCVNDGAVVISNAKAKVVGTINYFSEVGGLVGLSVADLTGNESNGNVSLTSCDESVRVGGLVGGHNNYSKTWKGDTISCTVSCDGACIGGAILGAFRSSGTVTLGTEDSHETVAASARFKGAVVTGSNIVGDFGTGPGSVVDTYLDIL